MKTFILRGISFILDMLLVIIISSIICIFNPNNNKINTYYKINDDIEKKYNELNNNIDKYLEDDEITKEEYNEIVKKYSYFAGSIKTGKNDGNIKKNILEQKNNTEQNNSYKIKKYYIFNTIIYLIISILYFGIFAIFNKGQTIFKKIFKLKIKNNNKIKQIIRSLIVNASLIYIIDIVLLLTLKYNNYVYFYKYFNMILYLYYLLFIILYIIIDNNKSIDDIILNTSVVRYNKKNKIIESRIFND